MQFERRMSPAEALMWRLDREPTLSSTFANVTFLDRPVDLQRFRRRLERASHLVPRLRQRVQEAPANLGPPSWVDDTDFDLERHVVSTTVVGADRDVLDLATEITAAAFDRRRPLWEFTLVEGLPDGRGALIEKLHHTVVDGEGGVKLSMQFLDLTRDAPEPPPLTDEERFGSPPAPPASPLDQMRGLVEGGVRFGLGVAERSAELLRDPSQVPRLGASAAGTARAIASQLADVERARSPLWTARSLQRHFEVFRFPLEPVRDAATSLDGTLNTAFLTAATAAAGAYHRLLGFPVEELRASMAISTRTKTSGANSFSLARFLVPTGDLSPADRFARIRDVTERARASSGGASLDAVATVANLLPTPLVGLVARQQAQTVDFATSNVKAAPFPLYIGGAKVLENYPVGPLLGVAFNLTLLSYNGSLDMGINVDEAAVTEPELLRACLEESFVELATLGR